MENWKDNLNIFFEKKNLNKRIIEFGKSDERQIQEYINSTIKPAFEEFKTEVNSRPNVECQILTSKKQTTSLMENLELRFYRKKTLKFIYKPFFFKNGEEIGGTFKYSIVDIYGDDLDYRDSDLTDFVYNITQNKILENLTTIFVEKIILK